MGPENEYRSSAAIRYMLDALIDLDEQLKARDGKLFLFEGQADKVIAHLVATTAINAVMCNRDYTPFSRARR